MEEGRRGILRDLTASSTSAALSASLFAHIKQVWASLLRARWVGEGGAEGVTITPTATRRTAAQRLTYCTSGVTGRKRERKEGKC